MAMQAESPAETPSAQVVGNVFVEQYYHVLHQSPELVFRFYQDSSVLSRPDTNGVMSSVVTMQGINDKILSLNYKDYIAEIKTADAQKSFGDGVIVLVTGYLTGKDNVRKKFVQSFFLAPQEKGYFVSNDIFRYVDDDVSPETNPISTNSIPENVQAAPRAEPEQPPVPHQPDPAPESSFEDLTNEAEVYNPSDNGDGSITDEDIIEPPAQPTPSEVVDATPAPPAVQDDSPKKSYASILKAMKSNISPVPAKRAPTNVIKAKPEADDSVKPAAVMEVLASTSEAHAEKSNNSEEAEGRSIYVRNLPQNATPAQLEEIFSKFGRIKQGGVQVRSNKQGFCFGFVEFESVNSVRSAIEASPITIGNRDAFVEEKRTTTRVSAPTSTNNGRGRGPLSRGVFRNEGLRGRGTYGGGRGYGRTDFRSPGEFSRARGPAGRGAAEGYKRVDQNETTTGGRHGGSSK